MTMMDGATSIWVVATRITALDPNTFAPDPGTLCYTTDTLMKLTHQPTVETGDKITQKNAAGNLSVAAVHDDIAYNGEITFELATPNPILEGLLTGATVLTASGTALGAPSGFTATGQTTLGTLAAGTYGYRASLYNGYGQSTAQNDFTASVASGSTGTVVIGGGTLAAGALGAYVFGRTQGSERFLGVIPNIGSQATSAVSGTGSVASLTVTPLTATIPSGMTFQISGDTNTPKIVFTATATATPGAVTVPVSVSQSVTVTIAAAAIVPVLVDTGQVTPGAAPQTTDTTGGPGLGVGIAAPTFGSVPAAASAGVSIECFSQAFQQGQQAFPNPYWRTVFPRVTGGITQSRDLTNGNLQTPIKANGRQNPNWGTGPFGDFQFSSTAWWTRVRCGAEVVPIVSLTGAPATN
jgi:hypothetical protein